MTTIGYATLQVIPSMKGIKSRLEGDLSGPVAEVGDKQGRSLGGALMGGIKKTGLATAAVVGGAITASLVKGWGRLSAIDDAQAKLRGLGHGVESIKTIMDSALASVRGTTFGLGDAASVAATAVAAGIKPGKELTGYLSLLGDTATITGASLGEIAGIINKTTTSQKVYTAELNQLADRGLPVFTWLQEAYGVSADKLRDMVSAGEVDAGRFREILTEKIGGAALESGGTVRGAMANVGAALGHVGASVLSGVFPRIAPMLSGLIGVMDKLGPVATRVGEAIGDGLGKAVDVGKQAIGILFQGDFKSGGPFSEDSPIVDTLFNIREAIREFVPKAIKAFKSLVSWVQTNWPKIQKVIGDVVSTVETLITGAVDVVSTIWDNFGNNILDVVERTWPRMQQIIEGALGVVRGIIETVTSLIKGDWSGVWEGIQGIVGGAWEAIQGIVGGALELLRGVIGIALETLGSIFKAAWDGMLDFLSSIPGRIVSHLGNMWGFAIDAIEAYVSFMFDRWADILGFFTGLPGRLARAAGDVFGFLKDSMKTAINAVISLWNKFHIPSFKIGGWRTPFGTAPSWTSPRIDFPDIPQLASGGIVKAIPGGILANIGEGRADEAVVPLTRQGLAPFADFMRPAVFGADTIAPRMAPSGGREEGMSVHVTLGIAPGSDRALTNALARMFRIDPELRKATRD